MATTDLSTLRVNVIAQTRDFQRGMRGVRNEAKSTAQKFRDLRMRILAATAVASGLAFLAKKTFDVGAAVEETASKYRTVFGPAIAETNAFIEENARVMGLTTQQAQELISTTGAVAQGFGATQRQSAGMATEISKLAGDIASFHNVQGGAEQVTRDLIGALGSEREALKKYGIVITETMVQQRALNQTGKEAVGDLTQLDKAYASVAIATEMAGVAVGDLERTQHQSQNTYRRVGATIREFRDDVATALLPALGEFLGMADEGTSGLEELGDRFKENSDAIVAWSKVAVAAIEAFIAPIKAAIRIAFNFGQAITNAFEILIHSFRRDFDAADAALDRLFANMGQVGDAATDAVESFVDLSEVSRRAWEVSARGAEETAAAVQEVNNAVAGTGGDGMSIAEPVIAAADSMKVLRDRALLSVEANTQVARTLTAARNEASKLRDVGKDIAFTFADTMATAFDDAEDAFRRFIASALEQLARFAARMLVMRALPSLFNPAAGAAAAFVGEGGIGGLGIFGLAHGGPARRGQPYVVGEQGPELFVPERSGSVQPNGGAITIDVRGMPPATNPLAMARDKDWLAFLNASQRELAESGA